MLTAWLKESESASSAGSYSLVETLETIAPSEAIKDFLQERLRFNAFVPRYLADLASELGWETVEQAIIGGMKPRLSTTKRGRFGEALACTVLAVLHGYLVPIPKHQYLFSPDQSLPSTDAIAIKVKGETVVEACFVESKLRTSKDNDAGVEGSRQLEQDYSKKIPYILIFTSQQLHKQNPKLFNCFARYLRNRSEDRNLDTFRLFLVYDPSCWSTKALENLDDSNVAITPLTVHVVKINDLAALIEDVYGRANLPLPDADE